MGEKGLEQFTGTESLCMSKYCEGDCDEGSSYSHERLAKAYDWSCGASSPCTQEVLFIEI